MFRGSIGWWQIHQHKLPSEHQSVAAHTVMGMVVKSLHKEPMSFDTTAEQLHLLGLWLNPAFHPSHLLLGRSTQSLQSLLRSDKSLLTQQNSATGHSRDGAVNVYSIPATFQLGRKQ